MEQNHNLNFYCFRFWRWSFFAVRDGSFDLFDGRSLKLMADCPMVVSLPCHWKGRYSFYAAVADIHVSLFFLNKTAFLCVQLPLHKDSRLMLTNETRPVTFIIIWSPSLYAFPSPFNEIFTLFFLPLNCQTFRLTCKRINSHLLCLFVFWPWVWISRQLHAPILKLSVRFWFLNTGAFDWKVISHKPLLNYGLHVCIITRWYDSDR